MPSIRLARSNQPPAAQLLHYSYTYVLITFAENSRCCLWLKQRQDYSNTLRANSYESDRHEKKGTILLSWVQRRGTRITLVLTTAANSSVLKNGSFDKKNGNLYKKNSLACMQPASPACTPVQILAATAPIPLQQPHLQPTLATNCKCAIVIDHHTLCAGMYPALEPRASVMWSQLEPGTTDRPKGSVTSGTPDSWSHTMVDGRYIISRNILR